MSNSPSFQQLNTFVTRQQHLPPCTSFTSATCIDWNSPYWQSSAMFPTNYIADNPRDALRKYVLYPKPPSDSPALKPLEDVLRPVDSLFKPKGKSSSADQTKSGCEPPRTISGSKSARTPNSKVSVPGRHLTDPARRFWQGYLRHKQLR